MRKLLFQAISSPIGYLYMRLWYGKDHKRILLERFNGKYYYAGMTVIWIPILIIVIVVMIWALVNNGISLLK